MRVGKVELKVVEHPVYLVNGCRIKPGCLLYLIKSYSGKISLIAEMNQSMHGLILYYCGNQCLKNLISISMYIERIQRYLAYIYKDIDQQVIEEECNEHMQVVSCLASRNFEAAEQSLLQHLVNSHRRTRNFLSIIIHDS